MVPIGNSYFFAGGSGGNFLRAIFGYYQFPECDNEPPGILHLNPLTGDCHDSVAPGWQSHEANELPQYKKDNPSIKLVGITFSQDDLENVVNMVHNKSTKFWMIRENINTSEEDQRNFSRKECQRFMRELDVSLLDFSIDFKTIMGLNVDDLHQRIVDYLGVTRLVEVDDFIAKYRQINKQYLLS